MCSKSSRMLPHPRWSLKRAKKMNPGVGVLNEKKKVLRDDKRGKGRDCP